MHEMAIAMSLLQMAEEEAIKAGCKRIKAVTVQYGRLTGIMPEALEFAFQACIQATPHADASLVLECLPLRIRCIFCNRVFGEEIERAENIACPFCGEVLGQVIEQGKELILAHIEAIP